MFFDIFFSALRAFFVWAAPKVAVLFGVYVLSANVINPIIDRVKQLITQQINSQAGIFVQFFELLGVYDMVSILFAAYIMAFSLKASKSALGK